MEIRFAASFAAALGRLQAQQQSGLIGVKVIDHLGGEVMKVFSV